MAQGHWAVAIMNALHGYRERSFLCDLTLTASDGVTLQVHSCVLAAAAPSLYIELTTGTTRKEKTNMACSQHGLQALVHYLYTGVLAVDSCTEDDVDFLTELLHVMDDAKNVEINKEEEENVEKTTKEASPSGLTPSYQPFVEEADGTSEAKETHYSVKTGTIHCKVSSPQAPVAADCSEPDDALETLSALSPENCNTDTSADEVEAKGDTTASLPKTCNNSEMKETVELKNSEMKDTTCLKNSEIKETAVRKNSEMKQTTNLKKTEPKVFLCNVCQKSFPSRSKLKCHYMVCKRKLRKRKTHTSKIGKVKKAPCPKCGDVLGSQPALYAHLKYVHEGKKEFCCETCGREFARKSSLLRHVVIHSDEKPFKCAICGKGFKSSEYCSRHEVGCETKHGTRKQTRRRNTARKSYTRYRCPKCKACYKDQAQRNKHRETCTIPKQTFPCNICEKILTTKYHLSNHIKTFHQDVKEHVCPSCNKGFATKRRLQYHQVVHENTEGVTCKNCFKQFRSIDSREKHEKNCLKPGESYSCSDCQVTFDTRKEWLNHKQEQHVDQQHICPTCGKGLLTERTLLHHIKYVHKDKDFVCATCGTTFRTKGHLKEHQHTVHEKRKCHLCSYCAKGFYSTFSLRNHELIHKQIKPFTCPKCEKKFTTKAGLYVHDKWHRQDRQFLCSYCDKRFVTKDCLEKHERCHTNERPFKCDICAKDYRFLGDLQVHKRSHTGERPYHCTVCSATYVHSGKLREHHRIKHGLNIPSRKYVSPKEENVGELGS